LRTWRTGAISSGAIMAANITAQPSAREAGESSVMSRPSDAFHDVAPGIAPE